MSARRRETVTSSSGAASSAPSSRPAAASSAPSSRSAAASSAPPSRSAAASSSPASPRSSSGASRRSAPSSTPDDETSHKAMRLLKRMKPSQLREISEAATALEKKKLAKIELDKRKRENKKKVAAFVAKNENFVDLVGDCYICLEPLLNNIGTTKFGIVSWKCRCTVPQKSHTGCLFSKISRARNEQATCDMCSSPIKFERTMRGRSTATIRFHQQDGEEEEEEEEEEGEESSEEDESEDDEESSEEEDDE